MIFIQEIKNGKAELRAIDERTVREVLMEVKDLGDGDERRWTLVFDNGAVYALPDNATFLHNQSAPEFTALLEKMAKILKV